MDKRFWHDLELFECTRIKPPVKLTTRACAIRQEAIQKEMTRIGNINRLALSYEHCLDCKQGKKAAELIRNEQPKPPRTQCCTLHTVCNGEPLPMDSFYIDSRTGRYETRCKACRNASRTRTREKKRTRPVPVSVAQNSIDEVLQETKDRLTREQYKAFLVNQIVYYSGQLQAEFGA